MMEHLIMKKNRELFVKAIEEENILEIKRLLPLVKDVNIRGKNKFTALMVAAKLGSLDTVSDLLNVSASLKEKRSLISPNTALVYAVEAGHTDIVRALLAAGDNLHTCVNNQTLLMIAAEKGHTETVMALLDLGINVNAKNQIGNTALFFAVQEGHIDVVNLLLAANIDKDAQNIRGETALTKAVFGGKIEIVKRLLSVGVNHNPLIIAYNGRNMQTITLIQLLEQEGVNNKALYILKNFTTFQYRLQEIDFNVHNMNDSEFDNYNLLLCPISGEIMNDPITLSSQQTYDRQSLRAFFKSNNNPDTLPDPLTRLPIQYNEVDGTETNAIMQNNINDFVSKQEAKSKHFRHVYSGLFARSNPTDENKYDSDTFAP